MRIACATGCFRGFTRRSVLIGNNILVDAIRKNMPNMALQLVTERYARDVVVILLEGGVQLDAQNVLCEMTQRLHTLIRMTMK